MMKLVVLCCVVAAASAIAPVYFAPAVIPSPVGYAAPWQQPLYNYRGPLSLAPGQPATILAADGRPLDTLDVNLDRSAHFVAKALDHGSHVLKKRSVTGLAVAPGPLGFSAAVAAGNFGIATPLGVGAPGVAAGIATNPIGLATPFAAGPFGVANPLVGAPIGLSTPFAAGPLAAGPLAAGPLAAGPLAAGSFAAGPIGIGGIVSAPLLRNF